jgi:hypothetical protein
LGAGIADFIARMIEWNPPKWLRWLPFAGRGTGTPEDLHLSRQGIQLGRMIAERRIVLNEIGEWMRRELGPIHPHVISRAPRSKSLSR